MVCRVGEGTEVVASLLEQLNKSNYTSSPNEFPKSFNSWVSLFLCKLTLWGTALAVPRAEVLYLDGNS